MNNLILFLKKKTAPGCGTCLFLLVTWYLLMFEDIISAAGIPLAGIFRNLLPLLAVICFFMSSMRGTGFDQRLTSPPALCGFIFVVSGMTGWAMYHMQSLGVTLQGLHEHLRFWLCLYLFCHLLKEFPLHRYARLFYIHAAVLSALFFVLTCLDIRFHIWGRQMFRYGTSSIQLFYSHPSKLGARAVFLLAMLCVLYPQAVRKTTHRRTHAVINTSLLLMLLGVVIMTLRVRLFGFTIFFLLLYFYMIIFRRRVRIPVLLAGAACMLPVGWRRFYDFYFSPIAYSMARGQLAVNSLDIARTYFPFGAGFGTFGSRTAQLYYSPLYYKYHMMTIPGLSPQYPYFACDFFVASLFGETGWAGTLAYLGLVLYLTWYILRGQSKETEPAPQRYARFAGICLLVYELLEATGTLSFSEHYSVLISLALAFAFSRLHR